MYKTLPAKYGWPKDHNFTCKVLYVMTHLTTHSCGHSVSLQWRHNERDSVSNHQPHDCLLNRLFRRRSKKTSKLRVTGLCAGNSPGTGEFPAQMACNAENVSIWWRHHVLRCLVEWRWNYVTQLSSYGANSSIIIFIRKARETIGNTDVRILGCSTFKELWL